MVTHDVTAMTLREVVRRTDTIVVVDLHVVIAHLITMNQRIGTPSGKIIHQLIERLLAIG